MPELPDLLSMSDVVLTSTHHTHPHLDSNHPLNNLPRLVQARTFILVDFLRGKTLFGT